MRSFCLAKPLQQVSLNRRELPVYCAIQRESISITSEYVAMICAGHQVSQAMSNQNWQQHRFFITQLYLDENMTLQEAMSIMQEKHHLTAS